MAKGSKRANFFFINSIQAFKRLSLQHLLWKSNAEKDGEQKKIGKTNLIFNNFDKH